MTENPQITTEATFYSANFLRLEECPLTSLAQCNVNSSYGQ